MILGRVERPTQPMFEPRSAAIYVMVAAMIAASATAVLLTGIRFSSPLIMLPPAWGGFLLISAWLARRVGHLRIAGACETIALTYFAGISALPLLYALAVVSLPFADSALVRADRLIGFNWLAVEAWFKGRNLALGVLIQLYRSFLWQPVLVLIIMWSTGLGDRAWRFVTASIVALLISTAIFPFVPAVGAFHHFGIASYSLPPTVITPWHFGDVLIAIKSGTRIITPNMFSGLVSFPSYHAAMALLFAWAIWPVRSVRWPFVLLNIGMALSAIIIGAHYFVDLIGGVAVGLVSLWITGLRSHRDAHREGSPESPISTRDTLRPSAGRSL